MATSTVLVVFESNSDWICAISVICVCGNLMIIKKETMEHFLRETVIIQPKYVAHILEESDERNTDTSTNYFDAPKYVVDVSGGAMSHTDVFPREEVIDIWINRVSLPVLLVVI